MDILGPSKIKGFLDTNVEKALSVTNKNDVESLVVKSDNTVRLGVTDAASPATLSIKSKSASASVRALTLENSAGHVLLDIFEGGVWRWGVNNVYNALILSVSSLQHRGYFSASASNTGGGGHMFTNNVNRAGMVAAGQYCTALIQGDTTAPSNITSQVQQRMRLVVSQQGGGRVAIGYGAALFQNTTAFGQVPEAELILSGRTANNADYSISCRASSDGYNSVKNYTFLVRNDGVIGIPQFAKASLPNAARPTQTGMSNTMVGLIFVVDDTGGPTLATSNGTKWLRVSDGQEIA